MGKKLGRTRARIAAVAATGLAAAGIVVVGTSTAANAASFATALSFSVSDHTSGATATYTWAFQETTAATLATTDSITLTVPHAVTGTYSPTVYGVGCSFNLTYSGTTFTLKPTASCTVPASASIGVQIGGVVNGTAVANTDQSTVTVTNGDAGTATVIGSSAGATTTVNVLVPESLTLTTNTAGISLTAIPGVIGKASSDVTLTVVTNATTYALHACVASGNTAQALTDGHAHYIASGNTTTATALGTSNDGLGANVAVTGATVATTAGGYAPWNTTTANSGGVKLGYAADCTNNASVVATGAATNGDTVTFSNYVYAKGTQIAGSYTGTLNYSAVPTF